MKTNAKSFEQMNELLRWKKQATKDDWVRLAVIAKTTPGHLDQLAYGWRGASPSKAKEIADATLHFRFPKPVTKEAIAFPLIRHEKKQKAA